MTRVLPSAAAIAIAVLMAVQSGLLHARQIDPNTYTFEDELTGLSIELPSAWERQDPLDTKRRLVDGDERFRRRRSDASEAGVVFAALASPYDGPPKSRPVLSCTALHLPAGQSLSSDEVRGVLQKSVQSTFGRGATVSRPSRIAITGHEAYRLSVSVANDGPGSGLFIALQKDRFVIVCAGIHGPDSRETVVRALDSIKLRAADPAGTLRAILRGAYRKFGCQVVPAFDTAMAVADRQKGIKKEDANALRAKVTFPMRASQYGVSEAEYREYLAQLLEDVYGHPALTAEDLGPYEVYKCDRVVNGQAFGPLDRYETLLRGCTAGAERKLCREESLLKLTTDYR